MAAAFIYVWIVPLFQPRGKFLWGHYRLKDIYAGIPIGLATLCTFLVLAVPKPYRRSISLRAVTAAIAVLVALAIADSIFVFGVMGALRSNYWLDQAHIPRRYSAADDELGFVRKPSVFWRGKIPDVNRVVEYSTDKNGFRNSTEQQQADVVFIGDSFTESATVSEADTFVRRVAQSTGLSAVNLGRGAYGPQQHLIVLKRYGLTYKPQVVVWQLFEGNDLNDAQAFAEWKQNPQRLQTSLKDRYFANSLLNHWLTNTLRQEVAQSMVTLRYHDGASKRVALRYAYEPNQPSNLRLGTAETMRAIEEGQQLCESRGIQLLILNVPVMVRVMADSISFDRSEDQKHYLPELKEGENDFAGVLKDACDRSGCDFVDSFDVMRRAAEKDNRNLYIPNDEHLDVGGHDVVAQIVEGWLRSKQIAPE